MKLSKPFTCKVCQKAFVEKMYCRCHVLAHIGNFKCLWFIFCMKKLKLTKLKLINLYTLVRASSILVKFVYGSQTSSRTQPMLQLYLLPFFINAHFILKVSFAINVRTVALDSWRIVILSDTPFDVKRKVGSTRQWYAFYFLLYFNFL